ncbi:MAG: GWxTD domain-containing protein [Cryomorphaceae bacterium]|nr:GWxTD domain-containing protein [Cryomorphaceae bacterium]
MRNFLILINVLLISSLCGQSMDMRVSYGRFFPEENETILETYFAFKGNSLTLVPDENGVLTGGIQVHISFYQEDSLTGMNVFRISIPQGATEEELKAYFTHTQRFALKPDLYDVHLSIVDANNEDEKYDFDFSVDLNGPGKVGFSDVNMLSSFHKAVENSPTSVAGFEMIPYIPRKDFYYGEKSDKLSYYAEFYNRTDDADSAKPFLIKYYIERVDKVGPIPGLAAFKRLDSDAEITPLLNTFNIESLASGKYFLVLEVVSQKNEVMNTQVVVFNRENPNLDEPYEFKDMRVDQLAGTFVEEMINKDSIVHFIDFLHPIADFQERRAIESLTAEEDEYNMLRFFYTFWVKRNSIEPYDAWLDYYSEVQYVNDKYGMRVLPGYQSDRGRIYLQYGPPTLVEDRRFETGTYPFEIWQYDQLKSASTRDQVDRIFVFVDREVNTNRYRLVHSTAQGERFNEFWTRELEAGRQVGEMYQDEHMMRNQQNRSRRGDWGSRATDNLIINPSSMGRYGRW